jgi:hypothetical protein
MYEVALARLELLATKRKKEGKAEKGWKKKRKKERKKEKGRVKHYAWNVTVRERQ